MTNAVMNVLVLAVLLGVSARTLRRMRAFPVVWAVLHLCLLTMVFDTAMIAADLYVFDPAKILGLYVWGAPVEDFAYAVAAAVGMPVLWTALGRRAERRRVAAAADGPSTDAPATGGPAADGTAA